MILPPISPEDWLTRVTFAIIPKTCRRLINPRFLCRVRVSSVYPQCGLYAIASDVSPQLLRSTTALGITAQYHQVGQRNRKNMHSKNDQNRFRAALVALSPFTINSFSFAPLRTCTPVTRAENSHQVSGRHTWNFPRIFTILHSPA